jgi:chaperonin GroES
MSVKIQPLADYVVAKKEEEISKTASGILLPDSAKEKPIFAKVVAVGKDVEGIKVGDQIIYKNEYETTTVKDGSQEYTIVFKKNIIAIVK